MNTFQTEYPLSPKKFWKKELSVMISSGIFALFVIAAVTVLLLVDKYSVRTAVILIVGILILWVVVICLYALYFQAYIRTYYYDGAENYVTIRKKFFTPQEIHVLYQKIQDVYVDQDLLDRMMGLYDVHIASATISSSIEAHIDGVDHETAEKLKDFFLDKVQHGSSNSTQQAPSSAEAPQEAAPVKFAGTISSETYPLQKAWLTRRIIGSIVASLFIGLWLTGFLGAYDTSYGLYIFIAGVIVAFIGNIIYIMVWRKNYRFEFLPEFILIRTGVINLSEKHVPYASIQDVIVSQTLLDRIFGIANVTIQNAARNLSRKRNTTDVVIPGQSPESAQAITEAVKEVLLTKNSAHTGL